jgi:hypothetical protein
LNVTNYPLYQQTIKTVLSEEAFARYRAIQTERVSYRHHALRNLVVATLDTRLLLSDEQRGEIETSLAAFPLPETEIVNGYQVLGRFILQINPDDMREWQQPLHKKIIEETGWVREERGGDRLTCSSMQYLSPRQLGHGNRYGASTYIYLMHFDEALYGRITRRNSLMSCVGWTRPRSMDGMAAIPERAACGIRRDGRRAGAPQN